MNSGLQYNTRNTCLVFSKSLGLGTDRTFILLYNSWPSRITSVFLNELPHHT